MKAIWNNKIIAESNDVVMVEGNAYFPAGSVNKEFLKDSATKTVCHWKGTASYYSIVVDGETNEDAAWYYADPSDKAMMIKDRVAFWRGVEVME